MKVRCKSEPYCDYDGISYKEIKIGEIYTVEETKETSTGTWISLRELPLNKYCVKNMYLSNHFEEVI